MSANTSKQALWPSLPLNEWRETYDTLHMWVQIVGKVQLELTPLVNHWWNVTLLVSARGLRSQLIQYQDSAFEIEFDFIEHRLIIQVSDGSIVVFPLRSCTVAEFYEEFMLALRSLDIHVTIDTNPKEFEGAIPFEQDQKHCIYDPEYANRHWKILLRSDRVFQEFRSRFDGKSSPVHFFWGSFDLAVTRFSGKIAPPRPEADMITREGYSHEEISIGFWPGSGNIQEPAYYAYAYPEPKGYPAAKIKPAEAFYNPPTSGYVLPYEVVRTSSDPEQTILDFLQSTYEEAAKLLRWDIEALMHKPMA